MIEIKEWFATWFDSKFYHILYKDRDYKEAEIFMQNLLSFLKLKKGSHILDLACGRGRHSVYLNKIGFKVTGVDLSKNSIQYAKQFSDSGLEFEVHDMRNSFQNKYDAIFNLFTSFGYFDDDKTNIKVLYNIENGLKENGIAVIDFMNVNFVKKHLIKKEKVKKENITFNITRKIKDNKIIKKISFKIDNKEHNFQEKVQFLTIDTIKNYINATNLRLIKTFGDYQLSEFDSNNSKRLILVLKK
jgi:cyclopropane fatty-acyl-phospholipid synthase-like methyltransferase